MKFLSFFSVCFIFLSCFGSELIEQEKELLPGKLRFSGVTASKKAGLLFVPDTYHKRGKKLDNDEIVIHINPDNKTDKNKFVKEEKFELELNRPMDAIGVLEKHFNPSLYKDQNNTILTK